jgi:serine/threonine-protein kinase PknG
MSEGCRRPGCGGSYAADGYCDECGHKRPAVPAQRPATKATKAGGRSAKAGAAGAKAGASTTSGLTALSGTAVTTSARTVGATVTSAGTVPVGHTGSRATATRRGGLGANLVHVPPVPPRDPTTAVMVDPQVPEQQRFCSTCGGPVGRSRDGKPGRTEGFCPKDRTPFSFVPALRAGDLVDDRYEVLGALAHGGLGWIYLARDRNISESGADRWVVLKGLINSGDADAMAAAVAERRFLVEVDHPNIVQVYDFASHPDPRTGERVSYIVMEYVDGRSLKDLALRHTDEQGRRAPLPLDQVLAYGIEILPALGYLHGRGMLFCDFKPDNVIHTEEQVKLIDLGAVRRIDDQTSPLWGTPGYQAPELAERGASIASDLYTVGRTMAVLSFDFGGFSTTFADHLPHPDDVPLLAAEESYHRLLLRATHADPDRRFGSAAEFAEQALGVLREVLAAADGVPRPAPSTLFTPQRRVFGTTSVLAADPAVSGAEVATALAVPLVDPTDPAAGLLATLGGEPAVAAATLRSSGVDSVEADLTLVRLLVEAGDPAAAAEQLAASAAPAGDWRRDWYAGLIALATDRPADAVTAFDAVYSALPGEPAARLALAAANELAGDVDAAVRRYLRVWRTDHGAVSAAFGLARMLLAAGDRAAAVAILDEVPEQSSQYIPAQVAAIRASLDTATGELSEADLVAASDRLNRLRLDAGRRASLAVAMLHQALRWLGPEPEPAPASRATVPGGQSTGDDGLPTQWPWSQVVRAFVRSRRDGASATALPAPAGAARFLGEPLREPELRAALERAYRLLASLEPDQQARWALVDKANAVRPRTVL